ncbi:MAG TPA: polysaccharide biosynthesis protein, partial [Daejeonella sp.]
MKSLFLYSKVLPKWIILMIDQLIVSWSFAVSFFVVRKFEFSDVLRGHFLIYLGIYCVVSLTVFFAMRVHTGIIRYSNMHDFLRIFSAVLNVSILYWVLISFAVDNVYNVSVSEINAALFINFFISSTLLILLRIGAKGFFAAIRSTGNGESKDAVLIYGSDRTAILIKNAVESSTSLVVAGFIDRDRSRVDKYIEQKRVYHAKDIRYLQKTLKVKKLLVVTENLKTESEKDIVETCVELGIKVCTVPPSDQWVYGKLSMRQLQELKIEDLLQREPIVIQTTNILSQLSGKRILVTGAAGSIGSEIVRQVMTYYP